MAFSSLFRDPRAWRTRCALLLSLAALSACADYTSPKAGPVSAEDEEVNADPWEGFNRAMYSVNTALDKVIVRPLTVVYNTIVPQPGRKAVTNVLNNLGEPVDFANSVLQGDVRNSFATFWRFTLNTTVGIAGINDVAGSAGLTARDTDFGETLALCGVPSGPYLYLPLLGPSTLRDGAGRGVDVAFDPLTYVGGDYDWLIYAKGGMNVIDFRSRNMKLIDDIYRNSLDPYATFRSGYLQRRTEEIRRARESRDTGRTVQAN